jgi:preprotein translocase subunit SecD
MQEEKIAATLGATALQGALLATLIGVLAIFVFIYINYGWKKSLITL